MKKAYHKDSRKMFKNNISRFISIVLIIMLGTAFFVGMNSVSPVMKKTAEDYMKEENIFDISIASNFGYTDEDIEKFKEAENVVAVEGGYSYDVLANYDNNDIVVRLVSKNKEQEINSNNIIEGREIKNDKECLICTRLNQIYEYKIGDKIKVYRNDDSNLEDFLEYDEYEIVGIIQNPSYLSKFYGNTSLLTGELHGYIIIEEEVFKLEEYTNLYIKTDIDKDISRFSYEYKEENEKICDKIKLINKEIIDGKYDEVYSNYSNIIKEEDEVIKRAENYLNNQYLNIRTMQLQLNEELRGIAFETSAFYNSNSIYEKVLDKENNIASLYGKLDELQSKKSLLEQEFEKLKPQIADYDSSLKKIENNIERNLYDIYSLKDEEKKFVSLSKEVNKLYFEYNQKNSEYKKLYLDYEKCINQLAEIENSITNTQKQIDDSQNELYNLFDGFKELIYGIGNPELNANVSKLELEISQLNKQIENLKETKFAERIAEAKEQVNQEKEQLNNLTGIELVTPLYENSGFKSLKDDLEKIKVMGRIFPVMFFVIAALVTITSITRMIEEDRKNIGTLKALGYSKKNIMSRYTKFSFFAGIIGTAVGVILGSTVIVGILFMSYGSLYDLPGFKFNINIEFTLIALVISFISTAIVALIVTLKELKENTASLMRPKNSVQGKTILLERIPFVWKRLDFLFKICFRNIFRYKRRLIMTLVGIAGCTALIYSGLSLQSAINDIGNKQFDNVRKLSLEVYLQGDVGEDEIGDVQKFITEQEYIKEADPIRQQSFSVEANDNEKDVFYIAISGENINKYYGLQNRTKQNEIELNDDGVVLTEKLANILKVKVGDRININDGEIKATSTVTGITENYLYNFVYITPNMYEKIYGQKIKYNEFVANITEELSNEQEMEMSEDLASNDKIASMVLEKNLEKEFKTSLGSLMSIVILFVGSASLLSFTVLINLNNINIEERKRELATIKLLGFYENELESYVFRENIILTILGTILGLGLGMLILRIIIEAAEVETIFLAKDINYINLIVSAVITLIFTILTNIFMRRKIKKINMIDSLKSVE